MAETPPRPSDAVSSNQSGHAGAHAEYSRRLQSAQELLRSYQRTHIRIGNCRLLIFIAAAVMAWLAFFRHQLNPWWLALPCAAFVSVMFLHDRVLRKRSLAETKVRYYERGLARIDDRWKGSGAGIGHLAPASHPYADDLDLFGPGGLFELLSTARTNLGENLLASWLLSPSPVADVRQRHQAIDELRPALDFRERLAITGPEGVTQKQADPLWHWGDSQAIRVTGFIRGAALVLSVVMAFAILWFAYSDFVWLAGAAALPPLNSLRLLIAMALFNGAFALLFRRQARQAIEEFESIRTGLALLSDLLLEIEHERFVSEPLKKLQARLGQDVRASRQLRRLNRFSDLLDSRDNLFVRIFGPPLLWTTQVSLAIEQWRSRYGRTGRAWVETVAEMEALSSLATYAYERHRDPFPEFATGDALFIGEELGHPLIPNCIRNTVSLDALQPMLIVSGSNMSGKSTLLRTIGINAVLAFAGAPVRAKYLRLSALQIGASLHISDSLAQGDSHFSAEIKRIRTIVDLAENSGPALFLIDEILQGTNSRDRLTGTQAILDRLLAHGAIGLITTHDLALTQLAGITGSRAVNVHFQDEIRGGQMVFDYRLKPGVVQGSNAVELMRLYGLI